MRKALSGAIWQTLPQTRERMFGVFQNQREVFWSEEDDVGTGVSVMGRAL